MTDLDRRLAEGLAETRRLELSEDRVHHLAQRGVAPDAGRRRRRVLRLLPALAGLGATAAVLGALIVASPDPARPPPATAATLSVLDRQPVPAGALPHLLALSIDNPGGIGCEVDPDAVRVAQRLDGGVSVHVAPGRPDAVAVFLTAASFQSGGCIPREDLRSRPAVAFLTGSAPGRVEERVVGLAVDGYDAVEVAGRRVEVVGNTFVLTGTGLPVTVTLVGATSRAEVVLDQPSRTPATQVRPFGAEALAALAREPALAGAPWIDHLALATIGSVAERPSLAFPPGVSYADALRALYLSAGLRGKLPAEARVAPPLPAGVVLLRPRDPAQGIAIDLRAPWAYHPATGQIVLPSLSVPPPLRQPLDRPWPDGAFVGVPRLPDCMVIESRGETRPPCARDVTVLSDDPDVTRTPLP